MISNEQLLAALNAVPPLEWEAVGKVMIRTTLPDGHTIEISREGHSTWLLFITQALEDIAPAPLHDHAAGLQPAVVTSITQSTQAPSIATSTVFYETALNPETWDFVGTEDNTL